MHVDEMELTFPCLPLMMKDMNIDFKMNKQRSIK